MTISPYEEAILCRESSRLRDEAMQRLGGETVAIGFTPGRKVRRKARRNRASTDSVGPAEATALPNSIPRAPRRSDA
jgi:hypothetical protein